MRKRETDRADRWQGRTVRTGVVCLVIGAVVAISQGGMSDSSGLARAGTQKHESESSWVRSYPLWMGIPRTSFAKLAEGVIHKRRWAAYAYRGDGREAGQMPCVEIGALYFGGGRGGSFQHGSACGPLAPPAEQPILNESGFSIKSGPRSRASNDTVIAVAVGKPVVDVKLLLSGGREIQKRTLLLSSKQASKANVAQFGYVVFAVGRKACVISAMGYDAAGSVLFRSPQRSCS
jgi:hypothetical protein